MGRANVVAFASLISALPACAQDLPTLAPLEIEGLPVGESLGPPALNPTEAPTISSETVAAFFDAAFDLQRLEHPMVGAVVSVVHDGEVIFQSGYGWADLSGRVPADPELSLFRIASITKAFVWTGIMQLVERGEIDLDADVNRYLDFRIPDSYEEPIRIRHLLTHTAGFEETWTGWGARNAEDVETLGPSLARLLPARVRPPGEHAAYSNYGAALAGYIIERVSGRPWAEFTETEILLPLGMQSTNVRVRMDSDLRRRHARGYVWRDGRFEATDFGYMHLTPAGLMSSTAADMAKFMLAHLNKGALGDARILREETADRMHSPLFAPYEELPPVLHGFYRSDRNGRVVFGHGGDTNQFHSNMSLLPDEGLGVFVSYNSDPAAAARGNVVAGFLDHFFPDRRRRPNPGPIEVDLSEYAGDYIPLRSAYSTFERVRSVFRVGSVSNEGHELQVGTGLRLVPTGKDRFTGLYDDLPVVFERDDRGRVTHILVGSPLSTLARTRGLEGATAARLAWMALFVFGAAVLGWGYRVVRPAPETKRLRSPHVRVAWVHAMLTLGLSFAYMNYAGAVIYGIPPELHVVMLLMNVNALLGLFVLGFASLQWVRADGTFGARAGYSLVAIAALVNLTLLWSYNIVAYFL